MLEFKSGLTWRSILAIIYTSMIFLPITIFLQLVAGSTVAVAAVFMTTLLFSEISRMYSSPLTKNELYIIYEMAGIAGGYAVFLEVIYKGYFVNSPLVKSTFLNGRSVAEQIPWWWAPPPSSEVYLVRTLFHVDWMVPIALAILQYGVFYLMQEISSTLILSMIFIEVEKLEFPFAHVDAEMCSVLAERHEDKLRAFIVSMAVGMIVAFLIYVPYFITGYSTIPLPWWDLTSLSERYVPGAIVGVATEPSIWAFGLLVPFPQALAALITSAIVWIIGNHVFLKFFKWAFPKWVENYMPNMSLNALYQRSLLDIWIVPQIAVITGYSVFILTKTLKPLLSSLKSTPLSLRKEAGYPDIKFLVALYLLGTIGSCILFHLLVPDFPIYIAVLASTTLSFLNALVGSRAVAEMGYSVSLPYAWNFVALSSGYSGVSGWLFTPVIGGGLAPSWVNAIKAAYLTETKPMDFIKAFIITFIAYHIFGYIYTSFFWNMAPIPSSTYPYADAMWPARVISDLIWIKGGIAASFNTFLYTFVGSLGFFYMLGLVEKIAGVTLPHVGVVLGFTQIPPYAISIFIGSAIGRFLMPKILGAKRWNKYRALLVAGFITGESLMIGLGVVGSIVVKAAWTKPF